jgi:GR25 family glycosyltransferase involved in LPS biosynthesis
MKYLYYLGAIGNPQYDFKFTVLLQNLKTLKIDKNDIDLMINIYSDQTIDEIKLKDFVNNIYIYREKMVLGEFWISNTYNEQITKNNYDYIILILDDIVLEKSFNFNKIIDKKNEYSVDIISPYVLGAGNVFNENVELKENKTFVKTNCVELFCYIITPLIFFKYISNFRVEYKWTWGFDLLLSHFGFTSGVDLENKCIHLINEIEKNTECFSGLNKLLSENGFTNHSSVIEKYPYVVEYYPNNNINIIGYIHVCQKGEWKRSFKMLIDCIKQSKLYENTKIIRLGVVNDDGVLINDEILNDSKFEIVYVGLSEEYERPTLLHMRKKCEEDKNTYYYYLHTKGITHFGNPNEQQIIDWINLMLYWNIEKWELAVEKLKKYDTYGCNDVGYHYSGNFWWAKNSHIKKLPTKIGSGYTDPEDWVQIINKNKINIYSSGFEGMGHYTNLFPREKYIKTNELEILCINLKRRPDRKEEMIIKAKNENIEINFFEAIDGKEIIFDETLEKLFYGNDFNYRKNVIGCSLSHYNIYKKILKENQKEKIYLILEDDAEFCENFKNKLNVVLKNFISENLNFLYLGFHTYDLKFYENNDVTKIIELQKSLYIGGTHGYLINYECVFNLLNYLQTNSMKRAIDGFLFDTIKYKFATCPNLIFAPVLLNNHPKYTEDTDIQKDYDYFIVKNYEDDEWIFYENKDYYGSDICRIKNNLSIEELKKIALSIEGCIAFNTLGWIKKDFNVKKLINLKCYDKNKNGIFVKK